jgi:HK97 family phage major capsid protein
MQDDRISRLAELVELRPEAASKLPTWIKNGTTYNDAKAELSAGLPTPAATISVGATREAQAPFESFGHFAQAVYNAGRPGARDTDPRLFAAATGINQGSPSEGGFAVPGTFANSMWDGLFSDPSSLLSQTDNYDVDGAFIEFPRVEETTRATGTVYGGVQAYWIAEAAQITASKPKFGTMRLEPQELAALVYVTEKHLNNSPFAIGQYVDRMGRAAIALKVNAALIAGDGVGKPKGLTTAASKITVTKEGSQAADTLTARNVAAMKARRIASVASQYVWLMNTDVQSELDNLSTIVKNVAGSENVGGFASPIYNADANTLGGLPILFNDHCEALGDEGDVILTHLPSYAVGLRRAGVKTAQSMHLRFDYAEMAFRFMFDIDGQSWLHTALTPAKGSTKSTVITLQAR